MALVCLCHGINERRVRREIEHGASSIEEVAERCHAGSGCFGCHPALEQLLADHRARHGEAAVATPRRRRLSLA